MAIKFCINCGTPVIQSEGRKEKKFCSSACRQKKWQEDQKALRAHIKEFGLTPFQGAYVPESLAKETSIEPMATPFSGYEKDILNSTWSGDLEKIMKRIDTDLIIGAANKAKLRAVANEHRTNFTN